MYKLTQNIVTFTANKIEYGPEYDERRIYEGRPVAQ